MKRKRSQGFTLLEVIASASLLVMAMGMAITGYIFTLKNVNEADVQNDLDIDLQLAMEHLKRDLRLSSLDTIFYHPVGGGPYQAISFPMAYDSTGDGIVERDEENKIIWDETIIYHIRPGDPDKLVKTTFSPRDNTLTDAQRQEQLDKVVDSGSGSGTYNGSNAKSKILFANLLDWEINPKAGRFDAYSSTVTRDRANLGYMLLDPGEHKITFTVVDKHSKSTGYNIGIDQLVVSGSASPREAEEQLPATSQTGASAINQYVTEGSWKGNRQLYFPASSIGSSFTLVMENDRWEETNFSGLGYQAKDARVEFLDTISPSDFVVQLDGMDYTWEAEKQAGSLPVSPPVGLMQNWVVRTLQKGADLADNGNWFAYNGRKCRLKFQSAENGNFRVTNVFIGESAASEVASMDFDPATMTVVKFGGSIGSPTVGPGTSFFSDWIDFPISKDKNYLVSYRIANNADKCQPAKWKDVWPNAAMTCQVITDAPSLVEVAKDPTWGDRSETRMDMDAILGLAAIEASFPSNGTYSSQIFDTHLDKPTYGDITWNADVPSDSTIAFKVRSGSQPDLSDADDWETITAFTGSCRVPGRWERYVQFQTLLQSSSDGLYSPILRNVTIDWNGETQLVNIGGIFTKGPDYGTFEISVDGEPLRSALIIDLEIYDDVTLLDGKRRRITSSLKTELTPRNSGM
ncbi:hypothetical protein PDESU_00989 [Pontiella desulfatans]|uniref:Uncharacterized protein n=1 Tax=Pontiella desulfatans TaxID=2750659 RepID=A0A6C2TXW7_PONDE|nr:prepilin-type N-terminal cleavage/methylation domain-containing protein [Pontiella desulfatans]VGO12437.1 hypothetical protein PDESU_00989 [Pontiella desulfatans]